MTIPRKAITVPGYRFVRWLEEGGQARIFMAVQEETNRRAAVKVIRPDRLGDPGAQARFEQEYQTLSATVRLCTA